MEVHDEVIIATVAILHVFHVDIEHCRIVQHTDFIVIGNDIDFVIFFFRAIPHVIIRTTCGAIDDRSLEFDSTIIRCVSIGIVLALERTRNDCAYAE
jgi:hypothetical protein